MKVINIDVTDKLKLSSIIDGETTLNGNFPLKLAEGNYKSVIMNFKFLSTTWTEKLLTKYATFKIDGLDKIEVELKNVEGYNDACYIPYDIFKRCCKVEVGVYGIAKSKGVLEKVVSTEVIKMFVIDGSYEDNLRNSTDISPTKEEQLEQKIAEYILLLEDKVSKEDGKGLSSNDFSDTYKEKIDKNTSARHTHSNKEILDNTTASYTTEEKDKLSNVPNPNTIALKDNIKNLFKDVTYNPTNGILTFTKYNDTAIDIDLPLELIVSSGTYDNVSKSIILTLANGDVIPIPVNELVNEYSADGTTLELKNINGQLTFKVKDNLFVEKEDGKGLSSNDFSGTYKENVDSNTAAKHTHSNKEILDNTTASYTTEEKNKLEGIEDGAQVNKIEKIIVNGEEQEILDKTINITIEGNTPVISTGPIYGIKRDRNSTSPEWERIEDSIGLGNVTPIVDGSATTDFDNIYPWSDIITYNYDTINQEITAYYGDPTFAFDGSNGEVLTRIPAFYYKRYVDEDDYEYILISKDAREGFIKCEQFSVGRYTISGDDTEIHSRSGYKPLTGVTLSNYRAYAKSLGDDFGLIDWHYFVIQLLFLVEYATYDSQACIGQGQVRAPSNNEASGGCNKYGMRSSYTNSNSAKSIIYRGIEDIFGNVSQFIDGVIVDNCIPYICYDPSKYSESISNDYHEADYTVPPTNAGWITCMGYDASHPLLLLGITTREGESNSLGDRQFIWDDFSLLSVGGGTNNGSAAGIFMYYARSNVPTSSGCGARLIRNQ